MMGLNNLEKILFTIDNGLIQKINDNAPSTKKIKREQKTSLLNKRIRLKINQVIVNPIKLLFQKNAKTIASHKNWLVYQSKNNYDALFPLENHNNIFIKPNKDIVFRYLFFYRLLFAIPLLLWVLKRKKLRWYFLYYEHLGVFEESERIIKKLRPKKLIFANDINPYQVALKIAAQNQNVPVYYFQHASISNYMPPLDFDVAFLEGQASLDKYAELGDVKGIVELIGMIKYQHNNLKLNVSKKVKKIGIASNLLDDLAGTKKMVYDIIKKYPSIEVHLRMHPRDNRKITFENISVKLSDSKSEKTFQFLNKIDLLIAGETSTHLEATLLNVVPVYYKFSDSSSFDVYGYIKNKLVFYAKDENELFDYIDSQIRSKSHVINQAKYYNEYIRSKVDYREVIRKYDI